jgi:hypothetical protein
LDKTCCRKEGVSSRELRVHKLDGGSKSTLIGWVDLKGLLWQTRMRRTQRQHEWQQHATQAFHG